MRLSPSFVIAGAWLLALGGGCQTYPTLKNLPVDCSTQDQYDLSTIDDFEGTLSWFASADSLAPAAGVSATAEPNDGGGLCGSKTAVVFRSSHANDWGSAFGNYGFGTRDGSPYEGVAFWARAPGNTGKSLSVGLDDKNTYSSDTVTTNCKQYGDGGMNQPTGGFQDPMGNIVSGVVGAPSLPDQCGNSYSAPLLVSESWRFYTLPFTAFNQTAMPNRVPNAVFSGGNVPGNGLLTTELMSIGFHLPKEAEVELWVDTLSFYRHKGWTGRGDAGVVSDAAQTDQ
jgi:hypothetical protein